MPTENRLFRNIGSVTISGALGGASSALFWLIAARRFPVSQIGIAGLIASLAAVVNVLTSFGFIGAAIHNIASRRGNGGLLLIGTSASTLFSVLGSVVVALAVLVIPGANHYNLSIPALLVVLSLLSGGAAMGGITDVVAGPLGNNWLGPVRNAAMGVFRIVLVLALPVDAHALPLAFAFALPVIVTAAVSTAFFAIQMRGREPHFWPDAEQRAAYWKFSLHSLPSTVVMSILPTAPPAIAVWIIGAKQGAVFYIDWNAFVLANLLIASATVLGISPEVDHHKLVQTVRRIALLCASAMFLGGPIFLLLYGHFYFQYGWIGISLLGLSLLPYSQEQLQITSLRRVHAHATTTRLTTTLAIGCFGGLILGAQAGTVWGMTLGWLATTTGLLVAGTVLGKGNTRVAEWFPSLQR